jgi:hypothetical protein
MALTMRSLIRVRGLDPHEGLVLREIRVRVVVCVDLAGKSGGRKDSGEDESEWTGNRMFLTQNELGELERFLPCENAGGRQYSDSTPTGIVK